MGPQWPLWLLQEPVVGEVTQEPARSRARWGASGGRPCAFSVAVAVRSGRYTKESAERARPCSRRRPLARDGGSAVRGQAVRVAGPSTRSHLERQVGEVGGRCAWWVRLVGNWNPGKRRCPEAAVCRRPRCVWVAGNGRVPTTSRVPHWLLSDARWPLLVTICCLPFAETHAGMDAVDGDSLG